MNDALSPPARPTGTVSIREARPDDLDAILALYNDAISTGTALWLDATVDRANRASWLEAQRAMNFPVFVAEVDATFAGYASYGLWRGYSGYRHTVDDSIYLVPAFHGRGIGSLLMKALIDHARAAGFHVMIADIESGNVASLRLHARFGFEVTGVIPEVGTKFGRWLDLTTMRLALE
ncbi:GNAT family N-acetyltransferase [Glaciihabitans tibetensis]|uniref:GNAT family N-acetyltransferase n=1 Tax=Glaciihabitans tibetensis TaxID=1266600 RepID=UPI001FE47330|nr:GNAT family N-acetyltransferase [Glaciihabitans tibetensis]